MLLSEKVVLPEEGPSASRITLLEEA